MRSVISISGGGSERVWLCHHTVLREYRALCGWDGPWSYTLFPGDFFNRRKNAIAKGFSSCLFHLLLCLSTPQSAHLPRRVLALTGDRSAVTSVWIPSKMTSSDSHVPGNCFPSNSPVPFKRNQICLVRHYEWTTLIIFYLDQLSTLQVRGSDRIRWKHHYRAVSALSFSIH